MTCRHPDIHQFGEIRCCLSCGEAVFETPSEPDSTLDGIWSLKYRYRPLRHGLGQEIRVMVLFAGEPLDELVCDIVVVNLADRPAYEALSYTWADRTGDASLSSEVFCGGKAIAITKNCEAALRRLRLKGRNRRLWVDAICINQNDTSEKNHQVKLMSKIYTSAAQVLAYIGVEPAGITNNLHNLILWLQDEKKVLPDELNNDGSFQLFLGLPYFDRVWIMQEVGLAQLVTLVVGPHEVRWTGTAIWRLLDLCSTLGLKPPSVLRWTPASRPEEGNDVLAVLSKSRNCSARDPRDKVYALLSLTHLKFSAQFPVDYSLHSLEVFSKLAVYCVEEMGRFDILQHCQHVSDPGWRPGRRTPSWVPQWDFKYIYEPLSSQFSELERHAFATSWHTSHTQPGAWLLHELPSRLMIERIVSEFPKAQPPVKQILEGFPYNHLSTVICRELVRNWSETQSVHNPDWNLSSEDDEYLTQQIVQQQSDNFTYKILERDAWPRSSGPMTDMAPPRTPYLKLRAHRLGSITRNIGPITRSRQTHIPRTTGPALGSHCCQTCSRAETSPALSSDKYEAGTKQERKDLKLRAESFEPGDWAFATEQSVGFTRSTHHLGDSVWILYGASVPFILREMEFCHVLVGDCYLHRAGRPFPCKHCGADTIPWPMQTEIIDIW